VHAIARFRAQADADASVYVYVVDAQGGFQGAVTLRRRLAAEPATPVRQLLDADVLRVPPETDREQVASIFARYDLLALPVVASDATRRLLGVITADDVIDVLQAEHANVVARMAGSDAAELEKKSPSQVATLRLPWIMATMFIELLAAVVIHIFDAPLTSVILLASFIPIISAISGTTGLQSAAIIVRGLSAGLVQLSRWQQAALRHLLTSLIIGGACGLVLGVIGAGVGSDRGCVGRELGVGTGHLLGHVHRGERRRRSGNGSAHDLQAPGVRSGAEGWPIRDRVPGCDRHQHLSEPGHRAPALAWLRRE
jgi:magnesium transporter